MELLGDSRYLSEADPAALYKVVQAAQKGGTTGRDATLALNRLNMSKGPFDFQTGAAGEIQSGVSKFIANKGLPQTFSIGYSDVLWGALKNKLGFS